MEIPPSVFPAVATIRELFGSNPEKIINERTASELNGKIEPEESGHPGMAHTPARATLRNDMGAYGGPGAAITGYLGGVATEVGTAYLQENPELLQNYPNPASQYTVISYTLPSAEPVELKVTDLSGRVISDIPIGLTPAGQHRFTLDVSRFQNGNYFYCVELHDQRMVKKLMVVR